MSTGATRGRWRTRHEMHRCPFGWINRRYRSVFVCVCVGVFSPSGGAANRSLLRGDWKGGAEKRVKL